MLRSAKLRKKRGALTADAGGPDVALRRQLHEDVLGNNGRRAEICQRILEIDAPTEGEAQEIAKQSFCKAERLCEWSLHADRIQIKSADFPS